MEGTTHQLGVPAKRSKAEKRAAKKKNKRKREQQQKKRKTLLAVDSAPSRSEGASPIHSIDSSTHTRTDAFEHHALPPPAPPATPGAEAANAPPQQPVASVEVASATARRHGGGVEESKRKRRRESGFDHTTPVTIPNAVQPAVSSPKAKGVAPSPSPLSGGASGAPGRSGIAKKQERALLAKVLESARKKHREEHGKGRPLVGWDIAALAEFAFGELVELSARAGKEARRAGQESKVEGDEDTAEAVAAAAGAVADMAEAEHEGQVRR